MKPEFLGSTTVSERGQVVIPQEAREMLKFETGEKLLVFKMGRGAVVLAKVSAFEKMTARMAERQKAIKKIISEAKKGSSTVTHTGPRISKHLKKKSVGENK